MKKKIFLGVIAIIAICFGIYDEFKYENTEISVFGLLNVEALSQSEITIIEISDMVNNVQGCYLEKLVKVEVVASDGSISFKYEKTRVRGSENNCKSEKDKTCQSFACYTNS